MHFFISVIDEQTGTATAEEMNAIDAFNDVLRTRGHWLITAPNRDVARALAAQGSLACNRRVELRPLLGSVGEFVTNKGSGGNRYRSRHRAGGGRPPS